jgi:hypothetical protein
MDRQQRCPRASYPDGLLNDRRNARQRNDAPLRDYDLRV